MSDKYILADGEPVQCDDLHEWALWIENPKARIVQQDYVGRIFISTVFLALDHNWGDGPPVLYETMIFGGKHNDYQDRYCTRDEALAGHAKAVMMAYNSRHTYWWYWIGQTYQKWKHNQWWNKFKKRELKLN